MQKNIIVYIISLNDRHQDGIYHEYTTPQIIKKQLEEHRAFKDKWDERTTLRLHWIRNTLIDVSRKRRLLIANDLMRLIGSQAFLVGEYETPNYEALENEWRS